MNFNVPKYLTEEPTMDMILGFFENEEDSKKPHFVKIVSKTAHRAWLRTRAGESQNWKCCWCGEYCNDTTVTLEHVVPISRGGKDAYENAALACARCNNKRGNADSPEHAEELKRDQKAFCRIQKWVNEGSLEEKKFTVYEWVNGMGVSEHAKMQILYQYGE